MIPNATRSIDNSKTANQAAEQRNTDLPESFIGPVYSERARKIARGISKATQAASDSSSTLAKFSFNSLTAKLKDIFNPQSNNPSSKGMRIAAMWGGLGIVLLSTFKGITRFVTEIKSDKPNPNRPNILMSLLQMFTGAGVIAGLFNGLTRNGKFSFASLKSALIGIAAYFGISSINNVVRGESIFSKILKLFGADKPVKEMLMANADGLGLEKAH
jgi:hypothetical protein